MSDNPLSAEVDGILGDTFGSEGCYCCGTKSYEDDFVEAKSKLTKLLLEQRIEGVQHQPSYV